MNNKKSVRIMEFCFALVVVIILTSVLFFKYIKFVDYAIITEGKTSASSISQMLELYYLSNEKYKQAENISFDEDLDIDLRSNTYFNDFSIIVPGNYKNSLYSVKLSTNKSTKKIEITLHVLKYQQKIFEIKKDNKVSFY